MNLELRQEIITYLKNLRSKIIKEFNTLETKGDFKLKTWDYSKGRGGGQMSVLRGKVFEKAAVNWSGVGGDKFPMKDGLGEFFATGVSLITHMNNPMAPTVHMNVRFIQTKDKTWFGGGYDLTPMGFKFQDDTNHFHNVAKNSLDKISPDIYPRYSKNAAEYFYIPHYQQERGVGGIFFDHLNSGNIDNDLKIWKTVAESFLPAIIPIYQKRINQEFSPEDKQIQLKKRAHYVEFNLLYDRGTKFGFQSGGNPEAILCSMPPLVSW